MHTGLHVSALFSLTSGAALLMIVSGTKKRMLHWRIERRRCRFCGRSSCKSNCRR